MSDCSRNTWKVPNWKDREEGVLYAPDLSAWIAEVDAIDVRGVRFVRERECELDRNGVCSACGASVENVTHSVYEMGDGFACNPKFCPNCGAKVRK